MSHSPGVSALETSRWSVSEMAGSTITVTRFGHQTVLVDFDEQIKAWTCSEDGAVAARRPGTAQSTCVHVAAATRCLPLEVAHHIASLIAKAPGPIGGKGKSGAETAIAGVVAESLARGAEKRAARVAEHDAEWRPATEVVVRQMTDEDRAKLEARRAAKESRYDVPLRSTRFA